MFSAVFILLQSIIHPFHVSVTEVKYKEEQKAIQISVRIFLDDLELALQQYSGNSKMDITLEENWDLVNENLEKYVLKNLKVYNEKGQMSANYIGSEMENDAMWTYVEIEKVRKLKSIIIWNSILTETYDDQENIIHFRAFDKVKSARLHLGSEQKVFNWEEE